MASNQSSTAGAIWWPALCGDGETPYDAFWSNELTINTSTPDIPYCFEYSVLTWLPALYLLLTSLIYVPYLRSFPTVHSWREISKLNMLKMVLTTVMVIMSLTDMITQLTHLQQATVLVIQNVVIKAIMMITVWFYTHWAYRKGMHSTGVLFLFWLILTLCDSVRVASYVYRQNNEIEDRSDWWYNVFYFKFALDLAIFLAHFPADSAATVNPANLEDSTEKEPLLGGKKREKTQSNPCPYDSVSFISKVFFSWFTAVVINGYKKPVQYADIWDIREEDSSEVIMESFSRNWENQLDKAGYPRRDDGTFRLDCTPSGKPSLATTIAQSFKWMFITGGIMQLTSSLIELVNPQILSGLILYIEGGDPFAWHGYVLAVAMYLMSSFSAIMLHHSFFRNYYTGMRVRTAITAVIYRKSLRLTSASRKDTSAGEITNLMSVDAQKMQDIFINIHYVWVSPIVIIVGTYALWARLGVAAILGIIWYAVVVPLISIFSGKFIRSFQIRQMKLKDARIKLMNQILSGMKVLKLYAWEPSFDKRISDIREEELTLLRRVGFLNSVNVGTSFCSSFIAALMTFTLYIFTEGNGTLPADVAFVSLSLLGALAMPILMLPGSVMGLVQGMVSVGRITKFLLQDEINSDDVSHNYREDSAICIDEGQFTWGDRPILEDINLKVPHGSLVAIVGPVGCGKSSIISAIMGEMQKQSGSINVHGSVAFVPQQAWIQNLTLRNNILFSQPYSEQKYQDILTNCALQDDLKILVGGDQIEIGERGINLSGGQKQRVALARACYQNSDIYLLDDPLSAVDSHVGKDIFDQVIGPKSMLRNKTRILTTNSVAFLSQTDIIVVLDNGRISECGSYEDLLSHEGAFAHYIHTYLQTCESDDEAEIEVRQHLMRRLSSLPSYSIDGDSKRLSTVDRRRSGAMLRKRSSIHGRRRKSTLGGKLTKSQEELDQKRNKLITEEAVEEGNLQMNVISTYAKAASGTWVTIALLGMLFNICGNVGSSIWLSEWSNDALLPAEEANAFTNLRIGIYALLGSIQAIALFMITVGVLYGTITASRTMHRRLLTNMLRTPMAFFDTTPLGRIINRFSKDINTLDDQLRMQIQFWMMQTSPILATIIVISYTTPIFIAVVVPLIILFTIIQRVYVTTARQVKRIDSVKRSPVYANFTETLNGTNSIRAYNVQQRFVQHADLLLDNNQKVWFTVFTSNRWIGVFAQLLGNTVVFFTAIYCVAGRDSLDPGTVGLSLTYAMQVGIQIVTMLRTSCELETYIVAVERIREYTTIPTEAPWHIDGLDLPPSWPAKGQIDFNDLCLRYREGLDLVLKGVTCAVAEGEKVGIVGRTGAGKSSMTIALFRIAEACEGSIVIDGKDITKLGLHDIRKQLTIMPQDPVVFSGSLRFNIDPPGEHPDQEIWKALKNSHLQQFVSELNEGLDFECGEDGQNMSVGQRQLLCLARALLRKPKVLVLDEATAAVDLETDDLIQETIRNEFKGCTILTIAHRLNTIMDYDRVMVMDKGKVVEFDTPSNLLLDESGIFNSMAKDAGLA